jgi:hypothetical protein
MNSTNSSPKKRSPRFRDWKPKFLDALAKFGVVSYAAESAGIHYTTAYKARERNPKFSADWDASIETAIGAMEKEAYRRAVKGTTVPVGWFQGAPGGYVQEYSDTLIIFLLKANRPEKYRETIKVEDWRSEIIALLRRGEITPDQILADFPESLAHELFAAAGVRIG